MNKRNLLLLLGSGVLAVVLLVLINIFGGTSSVGPSEADARAIAAAVLSEVEGSHRGLLVEVETNAPITLHVDLSASMNGFALADSKSSHNRPYLELLDHLHERWRVSLHAMGTKVPKEGEYPRDLTVFRSQLSYNGGFDMAAAIRDFTRERQRTHLLVTDSQPWDFGPTPGYEDIASAINGFLAAGGYCTLALFRSPFLGTYPSPLPGESQPFYQCDNRPFALWILTNSRGAAPEILSDISKRLSQAPVQAVFRFGEPALELQVTNRGWVTGADGSAARLNLGDIFEMRTGKEEGRIRDYRLLKLMARGFDARGYVPLQFDVAMTNPPPGWTTVEGIRKDWRANLTCWLVEDGSRVRATRPNVARTNSAAEGRDADRSAGGWTNRTDVTAEGIRLSQVWSRDLEFEVQMPGSASNGGETGSGVQRSSNVRVVVQVQRPGPGRRYAWLLTIRPKQSGVGGTAADFSTRDDRPRESCDRILRLDDMLTIIAQRADKLGSVIFVTDMPN